MSDQPDIESRLRRLEDRLELRELVGRYALAIDDRNMEALRNLFAQDASLRSADGAMSLDGRDAIIAELSRRFASLGPSNHFNHDHLLEFSADDADRATGVLTAHAEMVRDGQAVLAAIRYHDEYRREGGAWRFASRRASYFYFLPAVDYATALPTALRILVRGAPALADYPESLPEWRAFYAAAAKAPSGD